MALTRSLSLVMLLSLLSASAQANETASRAWYLYANAHYEDALLLLDSVDDDALAPLDRQTVREYRALCLLALMRTDSAAAVVADIVDADPLYVPSSEYRPPRFHELVAKVRRERIAELAHARYLLATQAFEAKRLAEAEQTLTSLLRLIERADVIEDAQEANWLSMLGARSELFLATIRAHAGGVTAPPGVSQDVFDSRDTNVVAPQPIRQDLPGFPPGSSGSQGELAFVVDTSGSVRDVTLVTPIHPDYDPLVLRAATFGPSALPAWTAIPFRSES